jgi:hypothetical protein
MHLQNTTTPGRLDSRSNSNAVDVVSDGFVCQDGAMAGERALAGEPLTSRQLVRVIAPWRGKTGEVFLPLPLGAVLSKLDTKFAGLSQEVSGNSTGPATTERRLSAAAGNEASRFQQRATEQVVDRFFACRQCLCAKLRGFVRDLKLMLGHCQDVTRLKPLLADTRSIDLGAVAASLVSNIPVTTVDREFAVGAGDIRKPQHNVTAFPASDYKLRFEERNWVSTANRQQLTKHHGLRTHRDVRHGCETALGQTSSVPRAIPLGA